MQAATYRGPGEIRIEETPEPAVETPTDAVVRITHTAICGSDLWFYRGEQDYEEGTPVGHEPMGIVEEVGEEVRHVEPGDRVFAPFWIGCGQCEFCRKGLPTSCVEGTNWGGGLPGDGRARRGEGHGENRRIAPVTDAASVLVLGVVVQLSGIFERVAAHGALLMSDRHVLAETGR